MGAGITLLRSSVRTRLDVETVRDDLVGDIIFTEAGEVLSGADFHSVGVTTNSSLDGKDGVAILSGTERAIGDFKRNEMYLLL